jgi:hypothetical protein
MLKSVPASDVWAQTMCSHYYICRCSHFHTFSAYYYICVLILGNLCEVFVPSLLYMRPRLRFRNLSVYHYMRVLMLLYMWPKTSKTPLSRHAGYSSMPTRCFACIRLRGAHAASTLLKKRNITHCFTGLPRYKTIHVSAY